MAAAAAAAAADMIRLLALTAAATVAGEAERVGARESQAPAAQGEGDPLAFWLTTPLQS